MVELVVHLQCSGRALQSRILASAAAQPYTGALVGDGTRVLICKELLMDISFRRDGRKLESVNHIRVALKRSSVSLLPQVPGGDGLAEASLWAAQYRVRVMFSLLGCVMRFHPFYVITTYENFVILPPLK